MWDAATREEATAAIAAAITAAMRRESAMPQIVPLTPAEQQLVKVIVRRAPIFAAKQWRRSVPIMTACALRAYAVGLGFAGVALLSTVATHGNDPEIPSHWLFFMSVCLALKAGGVKAGRLAAGLSVVSYFAVFAVPRSADWLQAIHEPKLCHLTTVVVAMLVCAAPPGAYGRRMRRIIASITARISVSSPITMPDRLRSVSTS
jgi:ABC-type polysaccharide/polyol phosphate export permease